MIITKGMVFQILDGSDWHGYFGTVDEIKNGIPLLFCINKPSEKFWLYPELISKVIFIG